MSAVRKAGFPEEPKGDLLDALEKAVRDILENPKTKPGERLSAIAHGTKLAAIRHKINGRDADGDFFG